MWYIFLHVMSAHENLNRAGQVKQSPDAVFGCVMAAFFFVLGLWPLLRGRPMRLWAVMTGVAFLLAAWLVPKALHPLNQLWTGLALVLHRITTPVFTALLFFIVVTPMALLLRILKRDLLHLRWDPQVTTYWERRDPPGPLPESMRLQF